MPGRHQHRRHEEFLIACLQREVSARESHGNKAVTAVRQRVTA